MINLFYSNGKILVWNEKDVFSLRKDHHIIGSLVGCYPIKPFQIQSKWLPLQLLPEEAKLLIDKGIAQLVSIPEKIEDPALIESFYAKRDKLCEEQVILLKEHRKKEILEKADVIYEGKKRKFLEALEKKKKAQKTSITSDHSQKDEQLPSSTVEENNSNSVEQCSETTPKDTSHTEETISDPVCELKSQMDDEVFNLDKDTVIEAELAKIPEVGKELCMLQLFTENPWKCATPVENWKYPVTSAEKLRYAIFKDLWEKGYYITTGTKFGGDFLAYEGDPIKYHALFIVVCMSAGQTFQGFDLVVYGRLGHQVKKTVALASLNEDGEVQYISLSWENEML